MPKPSIFVFAWSGGRPAGLLQRRPNACAQANTYLGVISVARRLEHTVPELGKRNKLGPCF